MKRILLSLLALTIMGGSIMAGDKPVITVADVEALPGETVSFAVNLVDGKADTYTAMTLYAQFPTEGFTTTGTYTVSSAWPGATGVVGSVQPDGKATIPFASANAITGSEVNNLVTISFTVGNSVAFGEYDVTLKGTMFEYNLSDKDYADDVTFKVKVVNTHTVVLDETSTVAPVAASGVNVRVKRAIKENSWSTICLPFAIPAEKMTAAFGAGVEVKDFTSWNSTEDGDNIVGITIGFTTVTAMEANHPYLIKVANAITAEDGFTVDGVDIDPEAEPTKQVGTTKKTRGYFYGTYVANTTVPEYNLFISNDRFYYSNGSTKMKAFRGYFELYDYLSSLDEAGARITMIDSDATGIANLNTMSVKSSDYYDLQGCKVVNPGKGLYINNGRKVVKR